MVKATTGGGYTPRNLTDKEIIIDLRILCSILSKENTKLKEEIKILNEKIRENGEIFCHPPNITYCKKEIRPEFDCETCKWRIKY